MKIIRSSEVARWNGAGTYRASGRRVSVRCAMRLARRWARLGGRSMVKIGAKWVEFDGRGKPAYWRAFIGR